MTRPEIAKLAQETCAQLGEPGIPIFVSFQATFTARLADARYRPLSGRGAIRVSEKLWKRADEDEQRRTVKHEAAHIVQFKRWPKSKPHGEEWCDLMRELGLDPCVEEKHHIPRQDLARKAGRLPVTCQRCHEEVQVTTGRFNRLVRGEIGLTHRTCGGRLLS